MENCVDSLRNSKQFEKNTDKLPSSKHTQNKINLYDKYKEKNQKKFKFPSPEPKIKPEIVKNKKISYISNEKSKIRPELHQMYKIFQENSVILNNISHKIKSPMSTQIKNKEKNQYTEISDLSFILQDIENPERNRKINSEIKENQRKSYENESFHFQSAGKVVKTEMDVRKRKNNTLHIQNPREKKSYAPKSNQNDKSLRKVKNIEEKCQKQEAFHKLKNQFIGEFSSVTSQNPETMMRNIKKVLIEMNYLKKKVYFLVFI